MLVSRRKETAHGSIARASRAVGPDAKLLEDRLLDALAHLQTAQRGVALGELYEAFKSAGHVGWDGDQAEPVSATTFATARDFLRTLPTVYPSPEVAALEDGSVAMDWFPDDATNFTVVVFPDSRIAFASASPEESLKGIMPFSGEVPEPILNELRRLF